MSTKRTIRQCDKGTAFATALIAGDRAGAAHATDAQSMAMFCENVMPLMVGAFSPRLHAPSGEQVIRALRNAGMPV